MEEANENSISIAFGVERNSAMDRGNLADLTAFVAVADLLSFRAAASRLGVTPSALSHSMRQLEERLGVRLLHRTTRSVSLTDAGRRLLDRLRPAIDQIAGALEGLNQKRDRAPADMIAVRVMGPMKIAVVGAPTYFARQPPPRTPEDLARHSCVQYRREAEGEVYAWPFERNRKSRRISVAGRVMVNDPDL